MEHFQMNKARDLDGYSLNNAGLQRPDRSEPSWTEPWADSARAPPACLPVFLDNIRLGPQSNQRDRKTVRELEMHRGGEQLQETDSRVSTGTNREV